MSGRAGTRVQALGEVRASGAIVRLCMWLSSLCCPARACRPACRGDSATTGASEKSKGFIETGGHGLNLSPAEGLGQD